MSQFKAIVLGATGLTGGLLVEELLKDTAFANVKIIVRRQAQFQDPKLVQEAIDIEDSRIFEQALRYGDILFCCIGTTKKKVNGNEMLYRQIDFDIPVNAARYVINAGVKKYILMSSVGANPRSSNFYLRLKGEVETAILKLPFESIHIMRPSFLLGKRNESRFGERVAGIFAAGLSWLLMGSLRKYKPIRAADVAKAMLAASKNEEKGIFIYHYADMIRLIH